jgi:hypothetical protein
MFIRSAFSQRPFADASRYRRRFFEANCTTRENEGRHLRIPGISFVRCAQMQLSLTCQTSVAASTQGTACGPYCGQTQQSSRMMLLINHIGIRVCDESCKNYLFSKNTAAYNPVKVCYETVVPISDLRLQVTRRVTLLDA